MIRVRSIVREIAIVAAATAVVMGGYAGVQSLMNRKPVQRKAQTPGRSELQSGETVGLKGAQFANSKLTFLLVTSPSCRFCVASEGFHRSLSEQAHQAGVPFYVAVPNYKEARSYLKSAAMEGEVRTWDELSFRVVSTPTLIVVDSKGVARAVLVGKLPESSEGDLRRLLADPTKLSTLASKGGIVRMTSEEFAQAQKGRKVTLLDVREREDYRITHKKEAINIPLLEFAIRAPFELDRSDLQVVDCGQLSTSMCGAAASRIAKSGFKVAELSDGLLLNSCQTTQATAQ
jgi:rhodanese-related sulfurtransferase